VKLRPEDRVLLAGVVAALLLMALLVLAPKPGVTAAGGSELAGEPRDVDVDLLRRRILSGELSDREALFYHRD
jgi:hypothetical protein